MSEFTLDIQLTELGFSNWNFPLCEPPSVKETFLPAQSTTEKPTTADCHEDPCFVPNALTEKSFLQDHQYFCPFKPNSPISVETAQSDSNIVSTEKKNKAICNSWNKARKRERAGRRNSDDSQDGEEEMEKDEEEQTCAEGTLETSSPTMEEVVSGEEGTDENEVEYVLTDDDGDYVDEDEEVEDDIEEEEEEKEEQDEDVSWSESNENGENKDNLCHVCDLTFSSLFLLREHLNMHTGVRPYRCDECSKQFCQLVNYRTHLRSHSQKASIHCRVCSNTFETEEQLQHHLDTNHFEKEFYQCDFCKQIFTDLELCKDHVEAHRQQAKRHLCLKCGSSFRHRNSLLLHLEWHSRGFFSCPDCERTFSSKTSLLRHSFSHLGVLPYTCLKCKRHFRLPSLYHSHECKPESIQCMACLVFFQSQEDFDKHKKETGCWGHQGSLQTKTDEIRCMECGKVFASVEELKKHGSTHQRVLKCAECGMGFRSALMLMSHMGGHAAQRPCLCQDCGLGFPHQQGFDSHLKTCGLEAPPVVTVKKPKLKASPTTKPVAQSIIFQTIAQPSNPAMFSSGLKNVQILPVGDQNRTADGKWSLTLNEKPSPGTPLVMLLPVPTSDSTQSSQTFLPSSLILETPSTTSNIIPLPMAPSNSVITKEKPNIPSNTLIPVESLDSTSKKRWTIVEGQGSVHGFDMENSKAGEQTTVVIKDERMNVATQVMENEQKIQSNMKSNVLRDEKTNPGGLSDTAEPANAVTPLCQGQTLDSLQTDSLVSASSEMTPHKSKDEQCLEEDESSDRMRQEESETEFTLMEDKAEDGPQGQNESGFDVEVEIREDVDSSSTEVEIGDEDSGVDMLDGELHECVTCGQVLPEKDMVQHYMKHAAVNDGPDPSPVNSGTHTTQRSPPHSPLKKRLRSGTVL